MEFDRPRHAPAALKQSRRLKAKATRTERLLWSELRALKSNWRRQAPIGRFVADFANHGQSLVVEVDGGVHRLPDVAVRDACRDDWLRAQGYRVLRFTDRQIVFDMPSVMEAIRSAGKNAPASRVKA